MKSLAIKYFGQLAEETGCDEEIVSFGGETIGQLIKDLKEKYPGLCNMEFQVAQNLSIVNPDSPVEHGEIALLPPFSGG